jgi:DNA-binding CsgD family transcriptional regulator
MRKAGVASRVELIALGRAPSEETVERALGASATRAEIGVAMLAAAGLSNAEIASRRGVSTRTIANQLARVFERARVSSRAELAAHVQAHAVSPGAGATRHGDGDRS